MTRLPPHRIARLGIGYCPEERGIFASLSAEENLMLPPRLGAQGMSVAELYEMFPNLYERRNSPGSRLSGGEQQMLAMARILRSGAELLLLDEITEGLAPVIVKALGRAIRRLKERGYTIVMVEQNFQFRGAACGPALRSRARPGGGDGRQGRVEQPHGHAARIPGCVTGIWRR